MQKRDSVFINCPLDAKYSDLFRAIVYAVMDCGMQPRCALEIEDAGQIRIQKIYKIIAECRFGVHDISRTSLDPHTRLPRFNMPFELGLFLGAKQYGTRQQREKNSLILDKKPFRYQKFISDIAGQDIQVHLNDPQRVVRIVRDWIQTGTRGNQTLPLPSGTSMWHRYKAFKDDLPELCRTLKLHVRELTYADFVWLAENWIERHP